MNERRALRAELLRRRREWLDQPIAHAAESALAASLRDLLEQLEPQCLGLYSCLPGEFNAAAALRWTDEQHWALPFAHKSPPRMDYRLWRGGAQTQPDDCGIPSSAGPVVVPDVVLVPCVGFSREGFRLGYGGGYFDRWLALHPGVTSVGLAWSVAETRFAVQPHDQALTIVLTERELIVA